MMLELTTAEIRDLEALVEARIAELSSEIHHSRVHEYRDELKMSKVAMERLALKLEEALAQHQTL